jgi:hypothetical protein
MQGKEQGRCWPAGQFPVKQDKIRSELLELDGEGANIPTLPDYDMRWFLLEQSVQCRADAFIAVS